MWKSNITSTEDGQTERERYAGGNVAERNFPSAENPSITSLPSKEEMVDLISPSSSFVSSPLSCWFLISLHLTVWLSAALFNTIWEDKTLCWLVVLTTTQFLLLPFYLSLTAFSPTLPVSLTLCTFWGDFCRFITKTELLCNWLAYPPGLYAIFCMRQRRKHFSWTATNRPADQIKHSLWIWLYAQSSRGVTYLIQGGHVAKDNINKVALALIFPG